MQVRGRYAAREASDPEDVTRSRALRARAFGVPMPDHDIFDDLCTHVMVEDGPVLVASFRLLHLTPDRIGQSYAAQFYDLSALRAFGGDMLEIGRFCLSPDHHHPSIVRVAWGAVAGHVARTGARLLFGCSSFSGTAPARYHDSFATLLRGHLAPDQWRPEIGAPEVFRYAEVLRDHVPEMPAALRNMPPLLRSYLLMGGWVSDHAVVDRQMNTLHVFTGLEIAAIPPARAAQMRALAP